MKIYKCKCCKEPILDNIIIIDSKPKKRYHQECYQELDYYKKLKDLIYIYFFEYTYPTVITKNLSELNKTIKYEYMYEYFRLNLKVLINKINGMEFSSAIQRWNYILAILKGNIEHFIKKYTAMNNAKIDDISIIEVNRKQNNSTNFDILD